MADYGYYIDDSVNYSAVCEICGGTPDTDSCTCPECTECGVAGDPACVGVHMTANAWCVQFKDHRPPNGTSVMVNPMAPLFSGQIVGAVMHGVYEHAPDNRHAPNMIKSHSGHGGYMAQDRAWWVYDNSGKQTENTTNE